MKKKKKSLDFKSQHIKVLEIKVALAYTTKFTKKTRADEAMDKLAEVERQLAASNVLVRDLKGDLTHMQGMVPCMYAQLRLAPFVKDQA